MPSAPLALVLAGGGARGAYEVGVLRYILGELVPRLGESALPRLFCGTSVGAINACALAAHAQDLPAGTRVLEERWSNLELRHVFRLRWGDLAGLARWLIGWGKPAGPRSMLDPGPLADLVRGDVPWRLLHENVATQRVQAVTVSATDIETGNTVVFLEGRASGQGQHGTPASHDPTVEWTRARLTPQHALASAAIPFLFPPVRVAGRVFTDGSVRQNTPLSPALRLGAGRVLVIGLRAGRQPHPVPARRQAHAEQRALSSPLFLFGKLLDALLLDRVETDLAALRRINLALSGLPGVVSMGRSMRAEGPVPPPTVEPHALAHAAFEGSPVGLALEAAGATLRPVRDLYLRPSQDLGALATEMMSRPSVRARAEGPAGWLMRKMGEAAAQGGGASDTLSYLLFDRDYARELISMGEADARALGPEIEHFLSA